MALNLTPLLFNLANCFTALIFYENVDFLPPEFPIATMTPRYRHYKNDSCVISPEKVTTAQKVNVQICDHVLRNHLTKGTRCIGVTSVYPPHGLGESDIYWYLNYYWSRSEIQKFMHKGVQAQSDRFIQPVHPPNVHIQILKEMLNESYEFSGVPYEFLWFARLPMLIISIPVNEMESESFCGAVAVGFNRLRPIKVESLQITSKRKLSSTELSRVIENVTRNKIITYTCRNKCTMGTPFTMRKPKPIHEALAQFIAQNLNVSEIDYRPSPWEFGTVSVETQSYITYRFDTSIGIVPERKVSVFGVTCSGLSPINSWSYLHQPYDKYSWVVLVVLIGIGTLTIELVLDKNILKVGVLVSVLLEQGYEIKEIKISLRTILGTFLLMGIVLSNGYKGVVTTSVVKPFDRTRIKSITEAMEKKYKILAESPKLVNGETQTDSLSLRQRCCRDEAGLSLKLSSVGYEVYFANIFPKSMECRNIVAANTVLFLLGHFKSKPTFDKALMHLTNYGNLHKVDVESEDTLLLRIINNIAPADCSFETVLHDFFSCNNTFVLAPTLNDFKLGVLQHSNSNLSAYNSIYLITDVDNAFQVTSYVTIVFPINVGGPTLLRVLRAFDQSGIRQQKLDEVDNQKNFILIRLERKRNVKLEFKVKPLSTDSNVYYVFILYLSLIGLAIAGMLAEIVIFVLNFCYSEHVRRLVSNKLGSKFL